jgi:uncharacterized protein YciI
MEKKYFFVRLNPTRSDFMQTMTTEERDIMVQHAAYWRQFMAQGKVIVFGPVLDAKGAFGAGVVAVEDEEELKRFTQGDPASRITVVEYFPMLAVIP